MKAGRREDSITLASDAQHLMTDVWTSVGVITGVGLVAATGWRKLAPVIAALVDLNAVHAHLEPFDDEFPMCDMHEQRGRRGVVE